MNLADLKKLNRGIARVKAKAKEEPAPATAITAADVKDIVENAVDKFASKIEAIKPPKITIPARTPMSYRATIERKGNLMTGARIEPIVKKSR